MTEKQKLIQVFKSLDFEALQVLLDDNRSYMDVSKDLFLSTLKEKLDKYEDLKTYENVVEGICTHCIKDVKHINLKPKTYHHCLCTLKKKTEKLSISIYVMH